MSPAKTSRRTTQLSLAQFADPQITCYVNCCCFNPLILGVGQVAVHQQITDTNGDTNDKESGWPELQQPSKSSSPWHHDLLSPHLKKILQQILADQGLREGASTFIPCLLCANTIAILGSISLPTIVPVPEPDEFANLTIKVLL